MPGFRRRNRRAALVDREELEDWESPGFERIWLGIRLTFRSNRSASGAPPPLLLRVHLRLIKLGFRFRKTGGKGGGDAPKRLC